MVADAVYPEYLWLVVFAAFGAFAFAFGTGANDVANAFGTSVGSKTLTMLQATIIAACFSFTGALLLGRVSTSTIAGGIADINAFTREPEMYALGMTIALLVSGTWNIVASYFELNVSSTHSIIGSIIGFSLIYAGSDAVLWATPDPASFPPYRGVVPIVCTWVFAPLATGISSSLLFLFCRTAILRRKRGVLLSFIFLPVLVFLTVWICVFFVLTRGAKRYITANDASWTDEKARWISAATAAGVFGLTCVTVLPALWWMLKRRDEKIAKEAADEEARNNAKGLEGADTDVTDIKVNVLAGAGDDKDGASLSFKDKAMASLKRVGSRLTYGITYDVHEIVEEDEIVAEIHKRAEVFDPKVEYCFSWLQVFSAICVIFSHGAGEVGFFAGPMTTVWQVYTDGTIARNVTAPIWIILIGAFGLVIGLATYGYKCTRGMGVRLSKLSPSRGFCAELATAAIILLASQYGLPTSSSQCVTGGIIGVGLCEGAKGVNWRFFGKQFASWVGTLFIVGMGTAALYAMAVYSPSKVSGAQQIIYENRATEVTSSIYTAYNATLNSYRAANLTTPPLLNVPNVNISALQRAITSANTAARALTGTRTQTADAGDVMDALTQALALIQRSSVLALGQAQVFVNSTLGVCNSAVSAAAPCVAPTLVPRNLTHLRAPGL